MKFAVTFPSFRRALGEIALIFLGITLALMFENWNSDRERKQQELNLLAEIYRDLSETRLDLERDINTGQAVLVSARQLLAAFDDSEITAEQFARNFYRSNNASKFFPKTSSYQSLKTIGMDLIENDELRKIIADAHELSLTRAETAQLNFDAETPLYWEFMRANFNLPGNLEITTQVNLQGTTLEPEFVGFNGLLPNDFEALRRNQSFKILVANRFNLLSDLVIRYLALDEVLKQTQEAIRIELQAYGRQP